MATPRSPRKKSATPAQGQEAASNDPRPEIEDAEVVTDTPAREELADEALAKPERAEPEPAGAVEQPEPAQGDAVSADPPPPEPEPAAKAAPGDARPSDPQTPEPAPAPAPVRSGGGGFMALLLGGVAAAAIGFALARVVLPGGWPMPDVAALQQRLADQDARIAAQQAVIDALPAPVLAPEVDLGPLTSDIADLRARLEGLAMPPDPSADLATLADRMTALEQREPVLQTSEAPDLAPLQAAIASLQAELAGLKSTASDAAATAEAARAEVEAAQAAAAAEQAAVAEDARALLRQATLAKLEAALQSGAPFADVVADLAADGVEVPAVLTDAAETGIPTVAALAEAFDEPARTALQAGLREDMGASVTERLSSFLRSQTGARSLEPREGDDPDAVLSRIGAAARSGDLAGALAGIPALPAPSQEALAAWAAQVQTRIAAAEASAAMSAQLGER